MNIKEFYVINTKPLVLKTRFINKEATYMKPNKTSGCLHVVELVIGALLFSRYSQQRLLTQESYWWVNYITLLVVTRRKPIHIYMNSLISFLDHVKLVFVHELVLSNQENVFSTAKDIKAARLFRMLW
jgi:hypothetical protein